MTEDTNQAVALPDEDLLTLEQVKASVPTGMRIAISQELVDKLNAVTTDDVMREHIKNNFLGYLNVMQDGKYKTTDYLNAITYVSYKLMNLSNKDAYAKTFPKRYMDMVTKGFPDKQISSYVSIYASGKLVNALIEQSMIPTWLLNQNIHQEAINHQYFLMKNAASEKVQTEAANSLLTHLKRPEAVKGQIEIGLGAGTQKTMDTLMSALSGLAAAQKTAIEGGNMKTIDVASASLVETEDYD